MKPWHWEAQRLTAEPDWQQLLADSHTSGQHRFYLQQPKDGFAVLGLGAARVLSSQSNDPIADIRNQARELFAASEPHPYTAAFGTCPILVGGIAFRAVDPRERGPEWNAFGNAHFVLPEDAYILRNGEYWRVHCAPTVSAAATVRFVDVSEPVSTQDYREAASDVIETIRSGGAGKAVLARQEIREGTSAVPRLLDRLIETHPNCATFAQGIGQQTFLGSSPERLIQHIDLDVLAAAVAGTSAGDGTELLHSRKELEEHAFVVQALQNVLEPICENIEIPDQPEVLGSGSVRHLQTLVRGRLRSTMHILELVAQLHPTPAVCGTPRLAAMDLIQKHENFDRGWYAGPIGLFDAGGRGDFFVALRCGLVDQRLTRLYAGAGLVADSNPDHEEAETRLKLESLGQFLREL